MCCAIAQIEIKEYSYARYEGEVNQHGYRYGKGVKSWSYGKRYVGEFRNHCYHGHGTFTHADGRVESGEWDDGYFLG